MFATDALAQRLLAEVESGAPPDWDRFWDLDQETWRQEIEAIRDQNGIVNDDCTLVVLRLPASIPWRRKGPGSNAVEESHGARERRRTPTRSLPSPSRDRAMGKVVPTKWKPVPSTSPTETHPSPEDGRDES